MVDAEAIRESITLSGYFLAGVVVGVLGAAWVRLAMNGHGGFR